MSNCGIMLVSLLNSKYTFKKFSNDNNCLEIISNNVKMNFNDYITYNYIDKNKFKIDNYDKFFNNNKLINSDIYSLLNSAKDDFKNCEYIMIIHTDEPFIDLDLANNLSKIHTENIADFTMCENYPTGIGIEIISYDTLSRLALVSSGNNQFYSRSSIFDLISIDINSYDIEVEVCKYDMRRDRLELCVYDKRNFLICENIIKALENKKCDFETLYEIIKNKPQVMRTIPAYIEIEITGKCDLTCIMCPRDKTNRQNTFMSKENYYKIIDDISKWCEDCVVCISGMGEPFLHPDIIEMINYTISKEGLKLIVETSGLHFTKENADKVLKIFNNNFHIIFSLESTNNENYKKIRGKDVFRQVEESIDYYISRQRDNTFISFTKMGETEDEIDAFYERWKNYQERIIILKYNDFRGHIKCTKSGDLSPIKRFPCWHLKRDMYINALCEAVLCKQDYKGEIVLGNVISDGIENCFEKGKDYFYKDYICQNIDYCLNCDEYYTYNF